jgi:tetratricopeptide (TPR) repeat protein
MKKLQEQFKEATKSITLTKEQKSLMREHLVEYMEYKPIRTVMASKQVHNSAPFFSFFKAHHLSGALIIALVVASSSFGVSFAADDALPGDLLYGVKVNINEEIKTALIPEDDTESRVAWEQERAELRLVEASQLVAEGRLDSAKQEQVSKLFAEHTEAIVERVLAAEETDPVFAAEASSVLEESLDTHEAVLARLIVEQEENAEEDVRSLVSQVRTVAMEAEKMRENAEEKMAIDEAEVTITTTTGDEEEAPVAEEITTNLSESANMRERATYRAKDRASELYTKAQKLQTNLEQNSDLALQAQAQIMFGKSLLDGGAQALEANNLGEAYGKYRKAAASFQKVTQLLEVAQLFSIEIYPDTEETTEEEGAGVTAPVEGTSDGVAVEIELARAQAQEAIETARKLLLTQEGFESADVEDANKRIKDASALVLRGEIATVLASYEDAKKFYKQAHGIATETISLLEKATEEGAVHEVEVPVKVEEPEVPEEKGIAIQHAYKDGKHTYSGTIQTPTPCYTLEGSALVAESFPEQITLELTLHAPEPGVMCIQVLAEKDFTIEVSASEGATFKGVRVNGVEKKWEVTPATAEKKNTATFEMKASENSVGGFLNRAF